MDSLQYFFFSVQNLVPTLNIMQLNHWQFIRLEVMYQITCSLFWGNASCSCWLIFNNRNDISVITERVNTQKNGIVWYQYQYWFKCRNPTLMWTQGALTYACFKVKHSVMQVSLLDQRCGHFHGQDPCCVNSKFICAHLCTCLSYSEVWLLSLSKGKWLCLWPAKSCSKVNSTIFFKLSKEALFR